ncbi:MAG TPA: GON domain-containing protein [Polyangiaceae bacterium]|jgi:hypothetical protein|nr:GON domain-containing protein [Polyangiaceae bacterium]
MRSPLALAVGFGVALTGCPAFLSDYEIVDHTEAGGDAAVDASPLVIDGTLGVPDDAADAISMAESGGHPDDAAADSAVIVAELDAPLDAVMDGVASDAASLEDAQENPGLDVASAEFDSGPLPTTCSDIASASSTVLSDGTYVLYYQSDPSEPWSAYCRNMGSAPVEYITLTSATTNFSQYAAGGTAPGTTVQTSYSKVRFVVALSAIDIADQTFATSTGAVQQGGNNPASISSVPYAMAFSCDDSPSGMAIVDLTGTAFAVVGDQFMTGGYSATGSAAYSGDGQIVTIAGGGYCGWMGPQSAMTDPLNVGDSSPLPLVVEYRQ